MSGLVKAKKYDWKDSNLALFGSDTEKNVKKSSAETEPAWNGAGQKVGIQIWRIVKFKVTHWAKNEYGKFYNGDSYILLNTYKEKDSEELLYDLHFWIGADSTQDEYGTAAYKTVELDTLVSSLFSPLPSLLPLSSLPPVFLLYIVHTLCLLFE
jgi:gelsolin